MTVVGLQWVQSTDTYSCPAADSIGSLTPATRIAACNSIDPWMSMVRCNLWDTGTQTATGANSNTSTAADRCYTDTDVANMGQVMVKIKKFWYGTNHTGSPGSMTYRWYISSTGADSLPSGVGAWKVHPAFTRNSVTKNQIYIGAYEGYYGGVSTLESVAGVTPTGLQTLPTFRTQAEARGTGWEVDDFLTRSAVQLLYLLEYGSFDSQGEIGYGLTNTGAVSVTGGTTAYGNASWGNVLVPQTNDYTHYVSYRGIENLWGNMWEIVDGVNIYNHVPYIADHGFVSDQITSPYATMGLTLPTGAGMISDFTTSSTFDYVFLGGTLQTTGPIYEWQYSDSGGYMTYTASGGYAFTNDAGLFCLNFDDPTSGTGADIGARLMYVG